MERKTKLDEREEYHVAKIPEKELFRAVIERALQDIHSPHMHVRREARLWLLSKSMRVFSYFWLCDQLGIADPVRVYKKVAAMKHDYRKSKLMIVKHRPHGVKYKRKARKYESRQPNSRVASSSVSV